MKTPNADAGLKNGQADLSHANAKIK